MKGQGQGIEFQIALLLDDVTDAKILSDGLRELGIFAHYYQDLDELWVGLSSYTPHLCIVDVKRMSEGNLIFKQHPKVKNHELKYAFFYKDSYQILLSSAYGMNHYGLIRGDLAPLDQLKSVLRRRQDEVELIAENKDLQNRIERLKNRSQKVVKDLETIQIKSNQDKQLKAIVSEFGKVNSHSEMIGRINYFFNSWSACKGFGLYYLNSTKQKLVSPNIEGKKLKKLPDLWLSNPSDGGIPDYAQEMAYDVSYGVIGDELVALRVFGSENAPDILIIAEFPETEMKFFNWGQLEMKLSSEYRRCLLQYSKDNSISSHRSSVFELFESLDNVHFHKSDYNHRLAIVDLSYIVEMTKQRVNNRFHWRAFEEDFKSGLDSILNGDFLLCSYGVDSFLVMIDKNYVEHDFNKLKLFASQFSFWKYFEDSSVIMKNFESINVRLTAPSSINIIRQMHDGLGDIMAVPKSNLNRPVTQLDA